jgi:large subunit ribosomal protein L29
MKAKEIRELDTERIQEELRNAYEELFNLRFQQATGKLSNTARFAQVRKDIARMKTILHERQLDAQAEA